MAVLIPTMPPPTEGALRNLTDKIGYPLPSSYVDFVRRHDGARPEGNLIATSDNEVGVSRFIPVHEASTLAASVEGFPTAVILFAEDDCGNYFFVEPRAGTVHFWDHEMEGADELVAQDALSFAEKLTPFDASQIKLAPGQVRRAWINPSFKPKF